MKHADDSCMMVGSASGWFLVGWNVGLSRTLTHTTVSGLHT